MFIKVSAVVHNLFCEWRHASVLAANTSENVFVQNVTVKHENMKLIKYS